MAATITVLRTPQTARVAVATFVGDSNYQTGGYSLNARHFGFTELSGVILQKVTSGSVHLLATWDPDTEKLLLAYPVGGDADDAPLTPAVPSLADTDDLVPLEDAMQREPYASMGLAPGVETTLELEGEGLVVDRASNFVPGGGIELPKGADASGVTVRVLGIGY